MDAKELGNELVFPTDNQTTLINPGLTKKELFVGLAMNGLLTHENKWSNHESLAYNSLRCADAVLEALSTGVKRGKG